MGRPISVTTDRLIKFACNFPLESYTVSVCRRVSSDQETRQLSGIERHSGNGVALSVVAVVRRETILAAVAGIRCRWSWKAAAGAAWFALHRFAAGVVEMPRLSALVQLVKRRRSLARGRSVVSCGGFIGGASWRRT